MNEIEKKNLLLQDICARLPYGVKVQNIISKEIYNLKDYLYCLPTALVTNFKPYLLPMSSMTEEEKADFGMFFTSDGLLINDNSELCEIVDWLNSHHFDYRGLIPKGLALEAPEGMYKK